MTAKSDTPNREQWASAIEDAEQVMLRWGHGQVRRVPDEIVEAIVAALRAPVSERGPSRAEHDIEQAFQVLEAYGVPRERARSIQNGIGVLATRIEREERFQKAMEADAARYRWLRGGVHLNRFALDRQIESEAEMDAAIDAEIAKSNERPEPGGKP